MLDLKITGAMVCDGTGNPWRHGTIGTRKGRFAEAGARTPARREIDASGLVAAPGFVDVHTHGDRIIARPEAENLLRQGITTIISGNCGASALPVGEFLEKVAAARPALNYATLVGHGTIRLRVMGQGDRAPNRSEMAAMKKTLAGALREGALGLSTGLFYVPGAYASTAEVIEMARVAAGRGTVYASHIRSAGGRVFEAVAETAAIGREAGIPVHISHLKVLHRAGRTAPDRMSLLLEAISGFRDGGVDLTFDNHPYPATCTSLDSVVIPPETAAGGRLRENLSNPAVRRRISAEVDGKIAWIGGPDKISIIGYRASPELEGATLAEAAAAAGKNAADTAMDLCAVESPRCIFHALRGPDIRRVICSENAMIASDATIPEHPGQLVHPRCFGTFPRVIRQFWREEGLLTLEQCIRRMTSFPARRFGLAERGMIRPGMMADLVLFDPRNFSDTAGFERPSSFPVGLRMVVVNGRPAWEEGKEGIGRHGRALGSRGGAR